MGMVFNVLATSMKVKDIALRVAFGRVDDIVQYHLVTRNGILPVVIFMRNENLVLIGDIDFFTSENQFFLKNQYEKYQQVNADDCPKYAFYPPDCTIQKNANYPVEGSRYKNDDVTHNISVLKYQ